MNKNIKLLIQTQYFPPEMGAPQSRLSELAQGLAELGFQVDVVTAMPNYPTGKIYPGYGGLFRKEKQGKINVYRSYIFPTQSASFIKRLLNYFSFIFSSFGVGLFLTRPDFIFTESPPLFLGISGYFLSKLKRTRWIFNVADLWPASVVELGIIQENSFFFKASSWLESFFYHKAAIVTGQSLAILKNITGRYPGLLTYHLSNGANPGNYTIVSNNNEKVKIMYAGLHGLAQGLEQIVAAAVRLKDLTNIEFIFIGDGPEKQKLIKNAAISGIKNVTFLDPIPKNQIPNALSSADILIVPLKIQLTGAVPSKLYEGMAAGKPIILIAESEAAEILRNSDCGIVINPGDIESLVDGIRYLVTNVDERNRLGMNGRIAVIENFNQKKIIRDFANFLQNQSTTFDK